ncbi:hypothetical protein PM10SUCC1_08420 [Propionigenium maris DSM 9537]|uniref:Uncharacterized protein n=1 Tax=Propionigenium maris DSM 9537 TaxID=1123000 RepID=A0A9W6GHH5_9FUSO|nr:hypothetical protein [Propionigenium maris]GLI55328.1 hypothetical protein PM10SUCC1_08420 [Propionigenium maris DSM 9537]
MTIEKLSKLLPELSSKDLNIIFSKSLNELFVLRQLSEDEIFTPKNDCLYIVKSGKVISTVFIEERLEFNMEFKEGECLGHVDLFLDEAMDLILKGMPTATLLELPIMKLINNTDIQFLLNLYNIMIKNLLLNTLKLIKTHAAKLSLSNEQYLVDFLISSGGTFTYTSTSELAQLLNMDIRTMQRALKRLIENKTLEKSRKILKIIHMDSAREILETS